MVQVQKDEQDTQETENVKEQAERAVEIESKLREEYHKSSSDDEIEITLNPRTLLSSPIKQARVTDIREGKVTEYGRIKEIIEIEYETDDGKKVANVPYPDDPADPSEPLVRLCNTQDIGVTNFADLSHVPVTPENELLIRETPRKATYRVILPFLTSFTFSLPTPKSIYKTLFEKVVLYHYTLPIIRNIRQSTRAPLIGTFGTLVTPLPFALPVTMLSPALGGFLYVTIGIISFYAMLHMDMEKALETY